MYNPIVNNFLTTFDDWHHFGPQPWKNGHRFQSSFETTKNISLMGRRNLIDLFSSSWFGPPMCCRTGKNFFRRTFWIWSIFHGQGMAKAVFTPSPEVIFFRRWERWKFLGSLGRLSRVRSCSIFWCFGYNILWKQANLFKTSCVSKWGAFTFGIGAEENLRLMFWAHFTPLPYWKRDM